MVLKCKFDLITKGKVSGFTTKLPDNFAGISINLIDGIGIPCRYKIVAIMILVNAVDVEIIPGVR